MTVTLRCAFAVIAHEECRGRARGRAPVVRPDGVSLKLILQTVDEPKAGKNRMHLDVHAADIEAETQRLVGLGATRLRDEPFVEVRTEWVLMADPEGNELCVCRL